MNGSNVGIDTRGGYHTIRVGRIAIQALHQLSSGGLLTKSSHHTIM